MDIVEFLRARLDEDESEAVLAQRIREGRPEEWVAVSARYGVSEIRTAAGKAVATEVPDAARHIARHDPERVLREVEAKRRMVDAAAKNIGVGGCEEAYADFILGALATIYADHPALNSSG